MKKFDVFIIGTGVSGTAIAYSCAKRGLSVGITDERVYGGTCALRGCIPKKVLWGVIHADEEAKRLKGKGIAREPGINWPDLMEFKNTFVESMPHDKEKSFQENGIAIFHGSAKFVGINQLKIESELIEAQKIVIATGAKPKELNIEGKEHLKTSDDFLELKSLPNEILFIGGGYIAFEFAHMAARCGSKVTIIHQGNYPLENFEQEMVSYVVKSSKNVGINLVLKTEVKSIVKNGEKFTVVGKSSGTKQEFQADLVINSSGRVPAVFDLDLEEGNVVYSAKGIEVNSYLQSISNPDVYAAGDVTASDGLPLTPLASMEAKIVSSQLTAKDPKTGDYSVIPTVVFTMPALASVGYSEEQAKQKNLKFDVKSQSVSDWYSAKRRNAPIYAFKILIEKESGQIIGAHLVGPNAEETINLFALAMKAGMKASEIKKILFAYPSSASDAASMI